MYQTIARRLEQFNEREDAELIDQIKREVKHFHLMRWKLNTPVSDSMFNMIRDSAHDHINRRKEIEVPILFKVKVQRETIYDNPNYMPTCHERWIAVEITGRTNYDSGIYTVREDKANGRSGIISFSPNNRPSMIWLGSAKYAVIGWIIESVN